MTPEPHPSVAQLLAFDLEAGVDCALMDEPVNRLSDDLPPPARELSDSAPKRPPLNGMPPPPPRPPARVEVAPDVAIAAARDAARTAPSLEVLRGMLDTFDGCALKSTATQLVFADGNPQARIMFVGEAPGRDEDIEGLPFVGRSGRLLDRMLAAIGLDRTSVYIANVIPWRPPGNRTPTPHETEICRPFIERQIELVNPKVLINLGGPSAKTLLNTSEGILRLRGNWRVHTTASGIVIPAMPTLHPAYLLRTPSHKKLAWRDFLEVKAKLRALTER